MLTSVIAFASFFFAYSPSILAANTVLDNSRCSLFLDQSLSDRQIIKPPYSNEELSFLETYFMSSSVGRIIQVVHELRRQNVDSKNKYIDKHLISIDIDRYKKLLKDRKSKLGGDELKAVEEFESVFDRLTSEDKIRASEWALIMEFSMYLSQSSFGKMDIIEKSRRTLKYLKFVETKQDSELVDTPIVGEILNSNRNKLYIFDSLSIEDINNLLAYGIIPVEVPFVEKPDDRGEYVPPYRFSLHDENHAAFYRTIMKEVIRVFWAGNESLYRSDWISFRNAFILFLHLENRFSLEQIESAEFIWFVLTHEAPHKAHVSSFFTVETLKDTVQISEKHMSIGGKIVLDFQERVNTYQFTIFDRNYHNNDK